MREAEPSGRGRGVRTERRDRAPDRTSYDADASHQPAGRAAIGDLDLSLSASPLQLAQFESALTNLHGALAVQRKDSGEGAGGGIHAIAQRGLSGGASTLPHLERIQAAFGRHDVSSVRAHTGGAAQSANKDMGSLGYASGNAVAFRGAPSLHTAAHEAAHVVQQRAGVALKGGIGQ